MGKNSEIPPSAFWVRLSEALKDQGLPTTQHGVARLLDMSQGSVQRWYHGEGLPELATCRTLAIKGMVSVDWLITGRQPKYPISRDPALRKLLPIWEQLEPEARKRVLRLARAELTGSPP